MAFQRIRIKNTNVVGKIPGADKIDVAELCINLKDQKLYSKDADGNVFELGKTAVNNGPIPPISGNEIGDLWWGRQQPAGLERQRLGNCWRQRTRRPR